MEADGVAGTRPPTAGPRLRRRRQRPTPGGTPHAFHHAADDGADIVHHREMAKLNAAIEERLAKMTRASTKHEASV
jgi:hypothetical protein